MLVKLFHREAYVAATATYTGLYRETCYAYAANQLNLTCRLHNDASEIYIKPARQVLHLASWSKTAKIVTNRQHTR